MPSFFSYETPVGSIAIVADDEAITHILFGAERVPVAARREEAPLIQRAIRQLREYFAGTRRDFDLPLAPKGTAFQQKVWQALRDIPYGQTCSYGDIAQVVGRPRAARTVGGANNRNPISIVIPCHRVVGSNGALVGYGGGLDNKELLLELERA
ncbi:MAG: methylated-DNA--[protein]-cysteine S-methyltransferase [Actinomycetes bacterium]|jgi:methylated-DNA-[protein]-cysteine S-methyltransferase|nr:methylated-DNA--[protein]-cysteine S-methyltransferase [Actinomycetes bacterium]